MTKEALAAVVLFDKECDHWTFEANVDDALQFVSECEADFNRCHRKGLIHVIRRCRTVAPTMNRSQREIYFRVGNEHSRVIYAHFGDLSTPLTESVRVKLIKQCEQIAAVATADEITFPPHRHSNLLVARFWWD